MLKETVKKYHVILICLLLALSTLTVYWQVGSHDFINLDDDVYVFNNPTIKKGLTYEGLKCAFSSCAMTEGISLWHPLIWVSLITDYQLYGLKPGGYHITNLLFHIANTILLFIFLNRTTQALWRSAFVAALFALHPLHVESVAWIAERKDVLSVFFFFASLLVYAQYAKKPEKLSYVMILTLFALGLMAKSMLVTFPFVLLLLDYWPLGRLSSAFAENASQPVHDDVQENKNHKKQAQRKRPVTVSTAAMGQRLPEQERPSIASLVLEKVPLFFLTVIFSLVTYYYHQKAEAITYSTPLFARLGNAINSYATYILKTFWPAKLAVFYPYPDQLPWWLIMVSLTALSIVTYIAILLRSRMPYLIVGWFWYLGTLVPVIGIIQMGNQAMADRYTYIPLIGLFIMIAWGVYDLAKNRDKTKILLPLSAASAIVATAVFSWFQIGHWKNSISLFEHTLRVTKNNSIILNNIGITLIGLGKTEEGMAYLKESIGSKPVFAQSHFGLGSVLMQKGQMIDAEKHLREALRIKPDYANAHATLGVLLSGKGKDEEAEKHLREALRIKPDFPEAQNSLGIALKNQGKLQESVNLYKEAIRANQGNPAAYLNQGNALVSQGKIDEGIASFREALRIKPDYTKAMVHLGSALLLQGKSEEAIIHFKKALSLDPKDQNARDGLRYAQTHRSK